MAPTAGHQTQHSRPLQFLTHKHKHTHRFLPTSCRLTRGADSWTPNTTQSPLTVSHPQTQTHPQVLTHELSLDSWRRQLDTKHNTIALTVSHPRIQIHPQVLTHELSLDSWRRQLDTNLTSCFLFSKYCLPSFITQQRGTIINIGSGQCRGRLSQWAV